jgi:predicted nucleic acid-binding protein
MAREPAHGLRSSDALHLAVAHEMAPKAIATLDATMADNAKRLKIKPVQFS